MTTTAIAHHTDSSRRRSLYADLVFWTAAGGVVAALHRPLGTWWKVPHAVLLDVGLAFAVFGPVLVLGLRRMRVTRGLVTGFVVTNLVLAPLAWVAAGYGWLPLSSAGNWALADAGVAMLVLGVWQLSALRASHPDSPDS